jgi:hypothetical protein
MSLDGRACEYAIAGARAVYLANFYGPIPYVEPTGGGNPTPPVNAIAYQYDTDGYISGIFLPTGEKFYEIGGENNTISFTDTLLAGGNGGKYRQHTLNVVLNKFDVDVLNEGNALSLGKFIAIVVDNAGRIVLLGRTGGLSAPAGGFDYNSGAAEADATGWTVVLQGSSKEIGQLLSDASVITPIYQETIVP